MPIRSTPNLPRKAMKELTTSHELLLQAAVIIVTIFTLDWWDSRFGSRRTRKKP